MTRMDLAALILSYLYALSLLISMEKIGKSRGWSPFVTRKLIHIGAGMWVWPTVLLFENWYIGVLPFFTFIFLNYFFHRQKTFSLMDGADSSLGTVYFAFSIFTLFLLFWRNAPHTHQLPIAMASTMVLTWGDAFAAIIGYKKGKHTYTIFGHKKTLEGSLAFFLVSIAALFATLFLSFLYSTAAFIPAKILFASLITSAIATFFEAVSPYGTDNLLIPFSSALTLFFIL
ncbi:MAG: phosphatidate cytidylyltransferase [candidate division KSB1 bacterium]|nr:phosphatidate cytidylyltransferase [candidate division KSB1 bacterium]